MPEKEITIEELWKMVDAGVEKLKEKDTRLQIAEDRIKKLQQLIPQEIRLPKPGEIPALIQGLREAIWGAQK